MGERETWTTEEFGSSHEGTVGVLLADGTVPEPVTYLLMSGGCGMTVSHWSVYDGRIGLAPRAHALRAVCCCGWTGPEHLLNWDEIGEQALSTAGADAAGTCMEEWGRHTVEVEQSAIALPEAVTDLLERLEAEIEKLEKTAPLVALRAARRLEVTAERVAYWPAHEARHGTSLDEVAAALGLNEDGARQLLARFGNWDPYS
ncbi:hypothetical protein E6W39_06560 [Kitasatospora acidiphila]|uniref:Uncharacterized protein n=1 Tax=Kitasatospora acidiphila TaxID=2567942 RepID=A0A540VZ05_9ACTN|nr:hypothetical protein [Kitasatospora acidiphila]TQF01999.1 hypothetical protein E6W39_06560 [Kitasatospora acidiphila]